MTHSGILHPNRIGALWLAPKQHPRGQVFLSAASGLVRSGKHLLVVADDELHLGVFEDPLATGAALAPGNLLRLLEGDLPDDAVKRKKHKPDLETLACVPALPACPHGALLALGSGSKPNRQTGVLLALDRHGAPTERIDLLDLEPLYAPLRKDFADLNIEGVWVVDGELLLLHRGNKGDARSVCIRYAWDALAPWLAGQQGEPAPVRSMQDIALGSVDGVPLSLTDGAGLPNGEWLFSAVAEDTLSSAADGHCVASAVGIVDARGKVRMQWSLQGAPKVEGVAVQRQSQHWVATLVTDPDNPSKASQMLSVSWPV
jgi:hypothetical protein